MDSTKIKSIVDVYQQFYFTHDEPVPFKGSLSIYPVLVKDYYNFYSLIDIFTLEKNEDPSGKGVTMTNLDYLVYLSKQEGDSGKIATQKIISLLELIFRIKNGIKCTCDEHGDTFMSYDDIYKQFAQLEKEYIASHDGKQPSEMELAMIFYNLRKCPKCGKDRDDIIRYNSLSETKQNLIVDDVEINDDDFDLLRKVVCYQNMPDFEDDYIDPELKAELELKAKLENPNNVQPTLEKQESCLVASTAYTYETIKQLSIRHLVLLLRTVDAKLHYFTYRQAEASGMVKFKGELQHWIYSNDKKSKLDGLQTLDDLKKKLESVAKM